MTGDPVIDELIEFFPGGAGCRVCEDSIEGTNPEDWAYAHVSRNHLK